MRLNIKESIVDEIINSVINETVVDKFTPYTPEEREQNFIPFTTKDKRTAFEKNPSYEAALKVAQERMRQRKLQKQKNNESIDETVKNVLKQYLKEDGYSYNGLDAQAEYGKMGADLLNQENRQKYYKKNIILFKKAYNKIYKEYTIIRQIKRKAPEAKPLFDGQLFLKYVQEAEGDTLYEPIWKKYGGEYEELADQYLQAQVIRLRKELDI